MTQPPFWRRPVYATRLSAHLVFALFVWPVFTVLSTAVTLMNQPYLSVDHNIALLASIAGLVISLPEMILSGGILFGLSAWIFSRLGPVTAGRPFGFARLGVEPLLTFGAVVAGISIWYPAALGAPLLAPLGRLPVGGVIGLLMGAIAVAAFFAARPGRGLRLAACLVAAGVASPAPMMLRAALEGVAGRPPEVVVLGVDSLSHHDDIATLKSWTDLRHGTWYEYPVAPGLLTNAVWSSILTMTPVRTHHVFHTFERLNGRLAFLDAARARGYHTVSVFPDQVTCAVGSRSGFDDDRSGPVGWRQVVLPAFANSSFLLPLVKPVFPQVWPMAAPANQAGTFTYDVRREIRGILRAGSSGRRTLVAAHLTYTHLAAYPGTLDMSWAERWNVARAPAGLVQDRSFDWQDVDRPEDPIKLQRWKLEYLLRVIREEVDATGFLGGGRELVVFSDHGHRLGLSVHTFHEERYHRVLLATFGVQARCPRTPISLIDIGSLLGFSAGRAEPVVEFAIAPTNLWPALMASARLEWAGDVNLDPGLLAEIFAGLLRHEPWPRVRDESCDRSGAPLEPRPR